MNLKRCSNGHFYDADKFASCPHCKPAVSSAAVTAPLPQDYKVPEMSAPSPFDSEQKTVSLEEAIAQAAAQAAPVPTPAPAPVQEPATAPGYAPGPAPAYDPAAYAPTAAPQQAYQPYQSYPTSMDDARTVSFYQETLGTEPAVGWLVCIQGEHYGESFPLKSGRNAIGRSASMDVALTGDMSVSRERQAIIIYEPRARIFIAQAGDARELAYLNDQVLLSNQQMKIYDTLSLGNEKLIFVPLCGPEFCWEDTKKN